MIVYHPIYDTNHCLIRTLKILRYLKKDSYEKGRIKIYDYFFLFPCETAHISLPRKYSKYKKICTPNRYNKVHDVRNTFLQLDEAQEMTYRTLVAFGFFETDLILNGIIKPTGIQIPNGLLADLTGIEIDYMELVANYFETIQLDDLRRKTKLIGQ